MEGPPYAPLIEAREPIDLDAGHNRVVPDEEAREILKDHVHVKGMAQIRSQPSMNPTAAVNSRWDLMAIASQRNSEETEGVESFCPPWAARYGEWRRGGRWGALEDIKICFLECL